MSEETSKINYDEVLQQDGEAIEAFIKNIYSKSVPPPQTPTKQDVSFWKIAGLESSLFTLSAIGGAILSAIRTGGLFYILEIKLMEKFLLPAIIGTVFGFASMATALLAFEGFVLAYGLTTGKKSGKDEVSKAGLVISIITIIAAGIFSSFSIVNTGESIDQFINILMALITGSASALVAFFSSENLGYTLNHVTNNRNLILKNHQLAFRQWRDNAVDEYLSSAYNIRHKRSQKIYGSSNPVQNPVQIEQQDSRNLQNNSNLNPAESEAFKKRSKVEIAYEWIENQYSKKKQLYTSREIVDGLRKTGQIVSVGSAFTALSKFKVDNSEELISLGLATQEDIETAVGTLKKQEEYRSKTTREKVDIKQAITEFIVNNKAYPKIDEIMHITNETESVVIKEMLEFAVENKDELISNGILTIEQVAQAQSKLSV